MRRLTIEKFANAFDGRVPPELLARLDRNFERLAKRFDPRITIVTTSYTIVETDDWVIYTGTGGHTIYFPHATAYEQYDFIIKHAGAGVLTCDATSKGQFFTSLGLVNSFTLAVGDGAHCYAANNSWQVS